MGELDRRLDGEVQVELADAQEPAAGGRPGRDGKRGAAALRLAAPPRGTSRTRLTVKARRAPETAPPKPHTSQR